jgi:hypothetical protein
MTPSPVFDGVADGAHCRDQKALVMKALPGAASRGRAA